IQVHLVAGDLPSDLCAHVDACSECGFVARLSARFGGATSEPAGGASIGGPGAGSSIEGYLGRYRLLDLIGSGGQGRVYRARDTETDDEVACKIVRLLDPGAKSHEVAHARRVRHPNVCRVFHAERIGDLQIIVMELLEG